jgi:hypothetical protein
MAADGARMVLAQWQKVNGKPAVRFGRRGKSADLIYPLSASQ